MLVVGDRWYTGDHIDRLTDKFDWDEDEIRLKCIQGTKREQDAYAKAGYEIEPFKIANRKPPVTIKNLYTMADVMYAILQKYNITREQLLGYGRSPMLIMARREAYYYCYSKLNKSTTQIGKFFSRDHSSIIDHIHTMEDRNYRLKMWKDANAVDLHP